MHRILSIGIIVLFLGCLAPSGGPASPEGGSGFGAAGPSKADGDSAGGAQKEEGGESGTSGGPSGHGDHGSGETEATPSWTPSSSASVGCAAATVATSVSLGDKTPLRPEFLGMAVSVRNSETGALESLNQHQLTMTWQVRNPATGEIIETTPSTAPTIDPLASARLGSSLPQTSRLPTLPPTSSSAPSAPKGFPSLEVSVRIVSTYVPRTIVGAAEPEGPTCEEVWEEILKKGFVLTASYQRSGAAYQGSASEDVTLPGPGQSVLVGPIVLSKL